MKKIISTAALVMIFSSQVHACGDDDDADTIILGHNYKWVTSNLFDSGGDEETDVFIDGLPVQGLVHIAYGDDEDADVIIEGFPAQGFAYGDDEDDADIIFDGGGDVDSAHTDLAVNLLAIDDREPRPYLGRWSAPTKQSTTGDLDELLDAIFGDDDSDSA